MAKKKNKNSRFLNIKDIQLNKQQKLVLGVFLVLFGGYLFIAFTSYLFTWKVDQNEIGNLSRSVHSENIMSIVGASISHFFVYKGFGISALIIGALTSFTGLYFFLDIQVKSLKKRWFWGVLFMIWISVFLGFFKTEVLSGTIGFEINDLLQDYLGALGAAIVVLFFLITFLVLRFKLTPENISGLFTKTKIEIEDEDVNDWENEIEEDRINSDIEEREDEEEESIINEFVLENTDEIMNPISTTIQTETPAVSEEIIIPSAGNLEMKVAVVEEEEEVLKNLADKLVEEFGEFDPRLELSNFKFPSIDLLKDYTKGQGITIDQEELEE